MGKRKDSLLRSLCPSCCSTAAALCHAIEGDWWELAVGGGRGGVRVVAGAVAAVEVNVEPPAVPPLPDPSFLRLGRVSVAVPDIATRVNIIVIVNRVDQYLTIKQTSSYDIICRLFNTLILERLLVNKFC